MLAVLVFVSGIPISAAASSSGADKPPGTVSGSAETDSRKQGKQSETEETQQNNQSDQNLSPQADISQATVTLDLAGGMLNGLTAAGWEANAGRYQRVVPVGTQFTLGSAYRPNYTFDGWAVTGGSEPSLTEGKYNFQAQGDMTITAKWIENTYKVDFYNKMGDKKPVWTVEGLPYGAVLWTDLANTPWEDVEEASWQPVETEPAGTVELAEATVSVTVGGRAQEVVVRRHKDTTANTTYYTFQIQSDAAGGAQAISTFYFTYGGKQPESKGQYFVDWQRTAGGKGDVITADSAFAARYVAEKSYVFNIHHYRDDGTKTELAPTTEVFSESQIQNGTVSFEIKVPTISRSTGEIREKEMEELKSKGVTITKKTETPAGMDLVYAVTVNMEKAFPNADESLQAENYLSIYVIYTTSTFKYEVRYHLKKLEQTENLPEGFNQVSEIQPELYDYVGTLSGEDMKVKYGSRLTVPDRPINLTHNGQKVDFSGFQVSDQSMAAVHGGILIDESYMQDDKVVVNVYYDRVTYYLYILSDSVESAPQPVVMQYGANILNVIRALRDAQIIKPPEKKGYHLASWTWEDMDGKPVVLADVPSETTMPAHDIYAIPVWEPLHTSIQVLYWIEEPDSSSYQNAHYEIISSFQKNGSTVEVATDSNVTVNLKTNKLQYTSGSTNYEYDIRDGFIETLKTLYGENGAEYEQYFSYNEERARISEGNIKEALNKPTNPGRLDGETYTVKAHGNGTTTINVFYTRNLYTIEFILGRQFAGENGKWVEPYGKDQVVWENGNKDNKKGTFSTNYWTNGKNFDTGVDDVNNTMNSTGIVFRDFSEEEVDTTNVADGTMFHDIKVQKEYRPVGSAERDPRAVTGRYGTKDIRDVPSVTWKNATLQKTSWRCKVYTITARFGADIHALWPTANNIYRGEPDGKGKDFHYISMGTHGSSYYYNTRDNANILNEYSTMDRAVISPYDTKTASKMGVADKDDEKGGGKVAQQMCAYWAWNGVKMYRYYFLYESLDTNADPSKAEYSSLPVINCRNTRRASNGEDVEMYNEATRQWIQLEDGQKIWHWVQTNVGGTTRWVQKLFVFDTEYIVQYSTNFIENQNPPAKIGYFELNDYILSDKPNEEHRDFWMTDGYKNAGNKWNYTGDAGNVYFFYGREEHPLTIANVNGYWTDERLLTQKFELTDPRTGGKITKSLKEIGWSRVVTENGSTHYVLKHGAYLSALNDPAVMDWILKPDETGKASLEYPLESM